MNAQQRAAYAAARERLLAAETHVAEIRRTVDPDDPALAGALEEFTEASEELVVATVPLADLVEQAWDVNVDAVQDAKTFVRVARAEQARVELEASDAARARTPPGERPILTSDEMAQCLEAAAATQRAMEMLDDVRIRFKAGVTAEQLEEVG